MPRVSRVGRIRSRSAAKACGRIELPRRNPSRRRLQDAILEAFEDPFKARRIEQAIEGSARTEQIVRLESSHYPLSFRMQIHHDYRATMAFLPTAHLPIVTHVFWKSAEPAYRRAAPLHEVRLTPLLLSFKDYARRAGLYRGETTTDQ